MSPEVVIKNPAPVRPYRNLMTLKTALLSAAVGSVGAILLYIGDRNTLWRHHQAGQALVNDLGAALVVSVALALLWELVGKRAFTHEILETAQTSADVNTAGLTEPFPAACEGARITA
jgi:peptidoglycan biosynthesis protein MviN/MurJ (putative lipid II flippase)